MTALAVTTKFNTRIITCLSTDTEEEQRQGLGIADILTPMIHTDTGDMFVWIGNRYLVTHRAGVPLEKDNPYGIDARYYAAAPQFSLAPDASEHFSLLTADTDIIFLNMETVTNSGELTLELKRDVTVTGGVSGIPANFDEQSDFVFPGTLFTGTNAPTGGTLITPSYILGSTSQNTFSVGNELINMRLAKNTQYSLTITNTDTATRNILVSFEMGAVHN